MRAAAGATALFLQEFLSCPQQIGAILPSSKTLASAMADWLPADPEAFVLELGPGTGVVTQTLLERGLRQDRLVAIEKSPRLASLVRRRFPHAQVITGDACNLDRLLTKHAREIDTVGAVISSLPLRVFSADAAAALARKVRSILQPEGRWVQYSYCLGRSRSQATSSFRLLATDVIWRNLPPARVNVYQKQSLS